MTGVAFKQNELLYLFEDNATHSIDDLEARCSLERHEVIRTTGLLINRGYVDRLENGVFTLTDAGVQARLNKVEIRSGPWGPDTAKARPPVPDTLRQRAWDAMRLMDTFSTSQIAMLVKDAPSENDHDNVRRYCRGLCDAGILVNLPTREKGAAETSNGFKRYRLFNDLGDIAPSHRVRKRDVFDHNSGEAFPCLS